MGGSIKLSVDSDLDLVVLVANAVRGVCLELASEETVDAIERAVVEAVNNVIKHGYGNDHGHNVDISLQVASDRIVVDIDDQAPPMPRSQLRKAAAHRFDFDAANAGEIPESGMGLAIIRMSMDKVEYRSRPDGNRLRMTKNIPLKDGR